MTSRVRFTRMMLAAVMVMGAVAGAGSARAEEDCAQLAPPGGEVQEYSCYWFDVPEGVDVLRVVLGIHNNGSANSHPYGRASLRNPVDEIVCSIHDDQYSHHTSCAVPGPGAGRWRLGTGWLGGSGYRFSISVGFEEARPVTGAALGAVLTHNDGAMFRFDGMEHAALISLASGSDLSLRVRRGAPPTFDNADCGSAQPSTTPIINSTIPIGAGRVRVQATAAAGTEDCFLEAGAGSIYAFVSSFAATTTARAEIELGQPCNCYGGVGLSSLGCPRTPLGGCLSPASFAISGAGA